MSSEEEELEANDPEFTLVGRDAITERICEAIGRNTKCRRLTITYCGMDDDVLPALCRALSTNCSIVFLEVSSCMFNSDGAALFEGLAQNKWLKEVALFNNGFGDTGCDFIANVIRANSAMKSLEVSGNNFSSEGIEVLCKALEENSSLEKIVIDRNSIGDEGAVVFSSMLQRNIHLNSISLSACEISTRGMQALLKVVKVHPSVTSLDVSWNMLQDVGADLVNLVATNKGLTELAILRCKLLKVHVEQLCRVCHHLQVLSIGEYEDNEDENDYVPHPVAHLIRQSPCLIEVCFQGNFIGTALRDALYYNGFIVGGSVENHEHVMLAVIARNLNMHEKCRQMCTFLIAIQKKKGTLLGRDCMSVLTKCMYQTKGDINAWNKQ